MKLIKLAFLSVVILGLIMWLISLLIPSSVRVSRAIEIHAPKQIIVDRLSDLESWKKWNELLNDQAAVTLVSVSSDTVVTSWRSGVNPVYSAFTLTETRGTTVVQWFFDFRLRWYPWEKFGSIIFDRHFGEPMEKSLNNLREQVQKSP